MQILVYYCCNNLKCSDYSPEKPHSINIEITEKR